MICVVVVHKFLSTLSLRRATTNNRTEQQAQHDFYPRSPCGERLDVNNPVLAVTSISIHALLAESDVTVLGIQHRTGISIHALLAESDFIGPLIFSVQPHFYPRSPCGERRSSKIISSPIIIYFYPRSPCGERRVTVLGIQHRTGISIHALLAESDVSNDKS